MDVKKILLACVVPGTFALFLSCSFAFAQDEKPPKPSKQTIAAVAEYKKLLAASFKDPSSTQFRNVRAFAIEGANDPKAIVLCGEVNAKNSYGAYTGFEVFISAVGYPVIGQPADFMKDAVAKSCVGKIVYIGPEK